MTRSKVLKMASIACLKELYSKVQPAISWDDFMEENRLYSKAYEQWESLHKESPEKAGSVTDFCGPRPYEFYYLPREIMKDICDSYIYAFKMDNQQELLDTIETLKNYCKEPIIDKYIDDWTDENGLHHPGYRSYDHPDNLEKELEKILHNTSTARLIQEKFFEFLDMAGNFFSWNRDLNSFNTSVYLGPSPNTNKEAVIENWKKYRNKDITINDYIEED